MPAPRHWRNWLHSGVALSAVLHVVVVAALTLSVPVFGRPAPAEDPIPVDLVPQAPEKKPPETKPDEAKKPEPPAPAKKAETPKAGPDPGVKRIPDPPKPAAPPPIEAAKPAPQPSAPRAEATRPAPAPPRPPPALALSPPPPAPEASLPPVPPPIPEAKRPQGPAEGLKVDADEVPPPPGERNALSYWVLEPLVVDLHSRCGIARITGALELRERIAEGRYRGLIRTRIAWARCAPEGAVHAVELRIRGGEVEMIGAGGSIDRGAMRGNTMMLEDAYGRSVWKKR